MTITAQRLPLLSGRDRIMITVTVIAAVAAGALHFAHSNAVLAFVVAAIALATLACTGRRGRGRRPSDQSVVARRAAVAPL